MTKTINDIEPEAGQIWTDDNGPYEWLLLKYSVSEGKWKTLVRRPDQRGTGTK